jgi:hypothetical protein
LGIRGFLIKVIPKSPNPGPAVFRTDVHAGRAATADENVRQASPFYTQFSRTFYKLQSPSPGDFVGQAHRPAVTWLPEDDPRTGLRAFEGSKLYVTP